MFVYDVDGDGDNDIVILIKCYEYGIVWMENMKGEDGVIVFEMYCFMNEIFEENCYGVKFL